MRGGEIVAGGAPLDLIVDKVQTVQSLFYRTAEYLKSLPLRRQGPPSRPIQEICRPWLFQSVAGSYQFAVAVQKPRQTELFAAEEVEPEKLTEKFLSILRASAEDPDFALSAVVESEEYRAVFLKLTRNLAPTGKVFNQMEVRGIGDNSSVILSPASRKLISEALRGPSVASRDQIDAPGSSVIEGVLRAVDLDKDWLEVVVSGRTVHVKGVGETVDDLIGPMVNHEVRVRIKPGPRNSVLFVDIEQDG